MTRWMRTSDDDSFLQTVHDYLRGTVSRAKSHDWSRDWPGLPTTPTPEGFVEVIGPNGQHYLVPEFYAPAL